jgi:uncharacterized protein
MKWGKIKNSWSLMTVLTLAFVLILSACGSNEAGGGDPNSNNELESSITFGTHPQGLAQYTIGSAFASKISSETGISATASPFAGPNAFMDLLNEGKLDFGILNNFDLYWAYQGIEEYDEPNVNLRMFIRFGELVQGPIMVRQDSGINSLKDLKGKKVATNFAGAKALNNIVEAALESVGLTWDDVKPVPVTSALDGYEAMTNGQVDATFGSPASAAVQELEATVPIKFLNYGDIAPSEVANVTDKQIEPLTSRLPGAGLFVTKQGVMDEEQTLVSFPFVVGVSAHLSEEATYQSIKAIWENYEELKKSHGWLADLTPEMMFYPEFIAPYHDGVVRFFKEEGIWNDEAEARQQELLEYHK